MRVNINDAMRFFRQAKLSADDLLDIEKAPALTIVNAQRIAVPVDTGATRNSIRQHIQIASNNLVLDHIGPETEYAPYIELGVPSNPNYPIQPFVRPSVFGNEAQIANAAARAFSARLKHGRR